jgi:hypothetical protein
MPTIGEIRKGHEIGYQRDNKFIWAACSCGKERWVICIKGQPVNLQCRSCAALRPLPQPKGTLENPEVNDIRRGQELGRKSRSSKYIWHACIKCGKQRWVQFIHGLPLKSMCPSCSLKIAALKSTKKHLGERHHRWKGGKITDPDCYIMVRLQPADFFYPMAYRGGYVLEHRLVMAQHLGRCLHPWEIVHHKNHIRDDNRIENLQLVTDDRHKQISLLEQRIMILENKVEEQRKLIRLLQWQIKGGVVDPND